MVKEACDRADNLKRMWSQSSSENKEERQKLIERLRTMIHDPLEYGGGMTKRATLRWRALGAFPSNFLI